MIMTATISEESLARDRQTTDRQTHTHRHGLVYRKFNGEIGYTMSKN